MEHHHPKQAHEITQAHPNTLLIDVRTEVEFFYVGHPTDAINIEWNTAPDFDVNVHFADQVLESVIPRSVRVSEAPSFGQTVIAYDGQSAGAIAYREAAVELIRRDDKPAPTTATNESPQEGES